MISSNDEKEDEMQPLMTIGQGDGIFPIAQLFVDDVTVETVKNLIDTFDLEITYGSSKGYTLRAKKKDLGSHKLQSITLFGAALFLLERYPECKLVLCETFLNLVEISKTEIQTSVETEVSPDFSQGEDASLSLSPGIQHYLAQAGFDLSPQEDYLKIQSGKHKGLLNKFLENIHTRTKRVG